jgi:N-acetylmuramoyl-L-alanine amidase
MVKKISIISILFLFISIPLHSKKKPVPVYRVVLNPGHGGVSKEPQSRHGDRYDPLSKEFLDPFKYGAEYRGIKEHKIVYSIARKTLRILRYCEPEGEFWRFKRLARQFTRRKFPRIYLKTFISRKKSISPETASVTEDPNAGYRFFDYPDSRGKIQLGRVSRINALKPHLVVSLHLASQGSRYYRGMNPVITVPYSVLYRGLRYVQDKERSKYFYKKFRYKNWCLSKDLKDDWYCYLDDVSFYFTSFHIKEDLTPEPEDFRGYRYNMVTWAYSDGPGWEKKASRHQKGTRYSADYNDVIPSGRFWERERSVFEKYRREGGYYGYGGDNLYAAYELIKFMQYYLHKKGVRTRDLSPGRPYIGTWIVPLHMNAVSPLFELGYLRRRGDRYILTRKQNEIAAGLAVGIYSLFAGIKVKWSRYRHRPAGRKIDFNRYIMRDGKSYFDVVVDR